MEIKFMWGHHPLDFDIPREKRSIVPLAEVTGMDQKFTQCLVGTLIDDGGVGYRACIEDIQAAAHMFENVLDYPEDDRFFYRETWGASYVNGQVWIHFVFDVDYGAYMELDDFKKIFSEWAHFCAMEPDMNREVILNFPHITANESRPLSPF